MSVCKFLTITIYPIVHSYYSNNMNARLLNTMQVTSRQMVITSIFNIQSVVKPPKSKTCTKKQK